MLHLRLLQPRHVGWHRLHHRCEGVCAFASYSATRKSCARWTAGKRPLVAVSASRAHPAHMKSPLLTSRRQVTSGALESASATVFNFVSWVASAYGLIILLVFGFQRKLLFLPNGPVADPRAAGGDPQVVVLPAGSGPEKYASVFFRPQLQDAPVLVYFHGNADQIGYGAALLGNYFAAKHKIGLYGIEYPGYGLACPGSPSEVSIYAAAEAMLHHLINDLGVPQSRIVLFGQSIGCAVAVEMARRGFGSRLVLIAPFTSTAEMACWVYPFLEPALKAAPWLVRDRLDNEAKASDIAVPSLVIHGKDDEIVPFQMGAKLATAIPRAQFLPVPFMGHNDAFNRPDVLAAVAEFASGLNPRTEKTP